MKPNVVLALFMALITCACNNSTEQGRDNQDTTTEIASTERTDTANAVLDVENVPISTQQSQIQATYIKDNDGKKKIKYTISEQIIDSLNEVEPLYDKSKYNRLAVSYFSVLADSFHGRPYFVESANTLDESILEILTTRINDGTDIVFLIDKTGSMNDDIETVKNSLHLIMNYLSKFNNVKVGIASYGDENYHFGFWYNYVDLTRNFKQLMNFMDSYTTLGNPDDAESVNDGIVKTIETMHWTQGNRRLLMVIGDAQSQEPPLSRNSIDDVIRKCNLMNVKFNLYPVIISATNSNSVSKKVNREFVKIGPNPANDYCTLNFTVPGNYNYEVNDISGRSILTGRVSGESTDIYLGEIPSGRYLIQVYNNKLTDYFSTPLIILH